MNGADDPVLAELEVLRRESQARRSELVALAELLPQATSRRVLVREMVSEIAHSPDRVLIAKRAALKAARLGRRRGA